MKTMLITKKNGKVSDYRKQLEQILKTLSDGAHTMYVTKEKSKRSSEQNSLFWSWMELVAQEAGATREDMHDYFCKKFLQRRVEINGRIETVVGGTRNLTKEQFAVFLEKVKDGAARTFGILLPDPFENPERDFQDAYEYFLCP